MMDSTEKWAGFSDEWLEELSRGLMERAGRIDAQPRAGEMLQELTEERRRRFQEKLGAKTLPEEIDQQLRQRILQLEKEIRHYRTSLDAIAYPGITSTGLMRNIARIALDEYKEES